MTSATSGQRSLMARRTLSATCNAELRVSCGSPKTTCDRDKQKSGGKPNPTKSARSGASGVGAHQRHSHSPTHKFTHSHTQPIWHARAHLHVAEDIVPHAAGPEAAVPEQQSKIASHAYTRQRTVSAPRRTAPGQGQPHHRCCLPASAHEPNLTLSHSGWSRSRSRLAV